MDSLSSLKLPPLPPFPLVVLEKFILFPAFFELLHPFDRVGFFDHGLEVLLFVIELFLEHVCLP